MSFCPILFDLDGTVADTYPGIVSAVAATLTELGLSPVAPERVTPLTGRGVRALVTGVLSAAGAPTHAPLTARAEAIYRGHYAKSCAEGAVAYPGVVELLPRLARPLALLTNKPREFTERILEALGLRREFDVVVAGDDPGARLKPDPWAITEALRRLDGRGSTPILVGDTQSDALAAKAAHVPCCIVRWGHGGAQALAHGCPLVSDTAELERLLAGGLAYASTPER